jgi:hypothetical protein
MKGEDVAIRIRKKFAQMKKGGHDFVRVYLANSGTLGTRVRIKTMKAMAKHFA